MFRLYKICLHLLKRTLMKNFIFCALPAVNILIYTDQIKLYFLELVKSYLAMEIRLNII